MSIIFLGFALTFAPQAHADVTIDATDFNIGTFTSAGSVVSNWVGSAFNISAPIYVGLGSDKNSVTISNFAITSGAAFIGWNSNSNSLTLLTNTTATASTYVYIGYGGVSNTLTISGGTFNQTGGYLYLGGNGSKNASLVITNGGQYLDSSYGFQFGGLGGNAITITGTGSVFQLSDSPSAFYGWNSANVASDTVTVANGGKLLVTAYYDFISDNNLKVLVTGAGSVWSNVHKAGGGYGFDFGYGSGASGNNITVSNGGALYLLNAAGTADQTYIGYSAGALSNSVTVTGPGSIWVNNTVVNVGAVSGSDYNSILITNGGKFANTDILNVGGGNNNSVLVAGGGILQENSLIINGGTGNTVSNAGGIYQFTTTAPTITPGTFGNIAINGGTISFLGLSTVDVSNSLKSASTISHISFAGANTLMLNGSSNDTANQSYTFGVVSGNPSNYANLVLVNGATAYRGGSVTISNNGSMLASNTKAAFSSAYTNKGTTVFANSVGTFSANAYNSGTWILDPSTNNYAGDLNNAGTMLLTNSVNIVGGNLINGTAGSYSMLQTSATYVTGVFTNQGALTILQRSVLTNGNAFVSGASTTLVSDAGSVWSNSQLVIGNNGTLGSVTVSNGAKLYSSALTVGSGAGASNNSFTIHGPSVVTVSQLTVATNNSITFNGGVLNSSGTSISNGSAFVVGNGTAAAILNTVGGSHGFGSGLTIASNSWLTGTGNIVAGGGGIVLNNGAYLSPGAGTNAIGAMTLTTVGGYNGAVYDVQFNSLAGGAIASNNWDFLNINGTLTNLSGGANFVIRMDSMGLTAGALGYSSHGIYALPIATFTGPLALSSFAVDASTFVGGAWMLSTNNNTLYLNQTFPISVFVWTNNASAAWSAASVWTNTPAVPATGGSEDYILQFNANANGTTYTASNNLAGGGASFTNNVIRFNNNAASGTNFLVGSPITFAAGASAAGFYQNNSSPFAVSNTVDLATSVVFGGSGAGAVILASNITGTGQITVQGVNNTVLQGSNTFAGTVTVNSSGGTLTLGNLSALGTNSITVISGTVVGNLLATSYVVGNGWSNQQVLVTGSGSVWTNKGAFVVGAGAAVNNSATISNGASFVSGALTVGSGAGASNNSFNIAGSSVVTVSKLTVATNNLITFSSGVLNSRGTSISNGLAFAVGNGTAAAVFNTVGGSHGFGSGLTIASNSWLTGTGSIVAGGGGIVLNNGAYLSPGLGTNGIGAMTLTTVGGYNGAVYDVQINNFTGTASNNWDFLNINGTLTNLSGGANFVIRLDSMGLAPAVLGYNIHSNYTLALATFTTPLALGSFTVDASAFGGNWMLSTNQNTLYLSRTYATSVFVWTNNANAAWDVNSAWTNTPSAPATGGSVDYVLQFNANANGTTYTASNNLAGAGSFTNNVIRFNNNAASGTNFLVGGPITFADGATVAGLYQDNLSPFAVSNTVNLAASIVIGGSGAGTVILASNITGTGQITVQGINNTVLQGSNTFVGPVVVNSSGGTLTLGNPYAIGTNSITVSNGSVSAASYVIGNGWSNQHVLVTGTSSVWNEGNTALTVGTGQATGNVLTVNGGLLTNINTLTLGGNNNSVIATNGGKVFGSGAITFDAAGSGNTLMTGNGLWNLGANSLTVGGANSSNNTFNGQILQTAGAGGVLVSGNGNTVILTNSSLTSSGASYLGLGNGTNSSVTLLANTIWNELSSLAIGASGDLSNSLTVNGGSLTVGTYLNFGSGNSLNSSLLITNGGQVEFDIGFTPGGNSGLISITGTGSVMRGAGNGWWFGGGNSNKIAVANGGKLLLAGTYDFIAENNLKVLVTDPGSVWSNVVLAGGGWNFEFGSGGTGGNNITVSNGGAFYLLAQGSDKAGIGYAASSKSNSVIVTGRGSIWSNNTDVIVGYGSDYNSVSIVNSGKVFSSSIYDGVVIGNNGSSNLVTVSGTGSAWELVNSSSYGGINLGRASGANGNQLIISNGASVINRGLFGTGSVTIGAASGANNNSIQVTGAGSIFTNAGAIYVGSAGANGNSLTVKNNAKAISDSLSVGNGGGNSNSVLVSSGGSFQAGSLTIAGGNGNNVTINAGTVTINASAPFGLFDGATTMGNKLVITNGGKLITSSPTFMRYSKSGSYSNSITVTGSGSVWSNTSQIFDSSGLGGDRITVAKGGSLVTTGGGTPEFDIGFFAPDERLTIADTGSVARLDGQTLNLGVNTANSAVVVSNGGKLVISSAVIAIGAAAGGDKNTLTVTGSGSVLSNMAGGSATALRVGVASANSNSLVISRGGLVYNNGDITIGYSGSSLRNGATVTGSGSVLTNTGDLVVGRDLAVPTYNFLTVSNGGKVFTANAYVGGDQTHNAMNSLLTVNGSGSVMQVANSFLIGGAGSGNNNSVLVNNRGLLQANTLTIAGGTGNVVTINGGTITVNATSGLFDGPTTHGNSLVIMNGGKFVTSGSVIRYAKNSSYSNSITVTGSGSVWSNTAQMFDQSSLGGDRITVANRGLLVSSGSELDIGYYTPNETLTVTDPGSVVRIDGGTYVGNLQAGSSLIVSNGAKLVRTTGGIIVGGSAGGDRNTLTVTGPGSVLSNMLAGSTTALVVGYISGNSNSMVISRGGFVYNDGNIIIGNSGGGIGNGVTVTDNGSVLTNTGDIAVGNFSVKQNFLTVTNGGKVFANHGYVGGNPGDNSDTNTITVTGAGSALTLNTGLTVGNQFIDIGKGNQVQILNGGLLEANSLTIYAGSTGNTISNRNGIYQFTAAPSINPNSGNIDINNGTISFRATTSADVRSNAMTGMTFNGANTFMLNAASNTAASGTQTYTFDVKAGNPTNYVNLVMVNGKTAYQNALGDGITIGSAGSMLISNTTATINGVFTNQGSVNVVSAYATYMNSVYNTGTVQMVKSVGTFSSGAVNAGTWITDPTTNVFQNFGLTNTASGAISMSAGDVYIFTNTQTGVASDFINISTNKAANNLVNGKMLFSGGLTLTQTFSVAGHDLGTTLRPSPLTATNFAYNYGWLTPGFTNNFALGTLEISNFSTVRVTDAFSALGPGSNDFLTAGLYLNNLFLGTDSLLIIDTNVQVYFRNSNDWSLANIRLVNNQSSLYGTNDAGNYNNAISGLHQIIVIPEPNVAFLWLAGAGTAYAARRRNRRRQTRAQLARAGSAPVVAFQSTSVPFGLPSAVTSPAVTSPQVEVRHTRRMRRVRRPQEPQWYEESWNTVRAIGQKFFWINPPTIDRDRSVESSKRRRKTRSS